MATRYSLTRPFTKSGKRTDYWRFLNDLNNGATCYSSRYVRGPLGRYMTFQAMSEAGLVTLNDGVYSITQQGEDYISYYNNKEDNDPDYFTYIKNLSTVTTPIQEMYATLSKPGKLFEVVVVTGEITQKLSFDSMDVAETTKCLINNSLNAEAF
jgi:hypothetical protein